MDDRDLTRLLRSLDQRMAVPVDVAEQIWSAVESDLIGSPSMTRFDDRLGGRWNGPLAGAAAAAVVLLIGFTTWAVLAPPDQPPVASTSTTVSTTSTLSRPQPPPDVVVGTPDDGFADVIATLDAASARWQPDDDFRYAYRVTVSCDCPDAGARWVRFFEDFAGPNLWDVGPLFARIRSDIAAEPDRVEVAFSSDDGHPTYYSVSWPKTSDSHSLSLSTADFHQIAETSSDFDGEWRFIHGVLDGVSFENPSRFRAIVLDIQPGWITFPIDCNRADARVDIYESSFGVGPIFSEDVFCGDPSAEGELFVNSLDRIATIRMEGSELVLSGPGVELLFVSPTP